MLQSYSGFNRSGYLDNWIGSYQVDVQKVFNIGGHNKFPWRPLKDNNGRYEALNYLWQQKKSLWAKRCHANCQGA
jgi:hypothetical protein